MMSAAHPDWEQTVNEILVEHEGRLSALEQDKATVHLYGAGTPWPDVAKLQIEELQHTVSAQTATINRLIDDIEHLKLTIHRYVNRADGNGQ